MYKSLSQRVISGSLIVFVLSALGSLLSYVTRSFYSHTLSIEMYGLFYAGLGLINLVWSYVDLGFGYSITYLLPKYIAQEKYKLAWKIFRYGQLIQMAVALASSLILFLLAPILSRSFFKLPGSEGFIYLLCLYLLFNTLLSSITQLFIGVQKEKYYSTIILLRSAITLIVSVGVWWIGGVGVEYYILSWIISYAVTSAIFLLLLQKNYSYLIKHDVDFSKKLLVKMSHFAFPMFFTTLVTSFFVYSDVFFLTLFHGVREVGVYNVVAPLATASIILISPIGTFLQPLITDLLEREKSKAIILINKLFETIPFISLYFALFLIIYPSTPIGLFFGNKWLGYTENVLIVFSLGAVMAVVVNLLGPVLLGMGKARERLKVALITTSISIVLNIMLIPKFGVLGAAATNVFISLLSFVLLTRVIRKEIKLRFPIVNYLKLILFGSFIFIFARILRFSPNTLVTYVFAGTVYSLFYFGMGYILNLFDKSFIRFLLPEKT